MKAIRAQLENRCMRHPGKGVSQYDGATTPSRKALARKTRAGSERRLLPAVRHEATTIVVTDED
jgi:hypothetical protein